MCAFLQRHPVTLVSERQVVEFIQITVLSGKSDRREKQRIEGRHYDVNFYGIFIIYFPEEVWYDKCLQGESQQQTAFIKHLLGGRHCAWHLHELI